MFSHLFASFMLPFVHSCQYVLYVHPCFFLPNLHMLVCITHKVQDHAIDLESESIGVGVFDVIQRAVEFPCCLVLVDRQELDYPLVAEALEMFW